MIIHQGDDEKGINTYRILTYVDTKLRDNTVIGSSDILIRQQLAVQVYGVKYEVSDECVDQSQSATCIFGNQIKIQ